MPLLADIAERIAETFNQVVSRFQSLETILGLPDEINASKGLHNDYTFSNGVLTQIVMWSDPQKTNKFLTKDFSYTNGSLTGLTTTRESGLNVLTTVITYDTDGSILSVTKDYA